MSAKTTDKYLATMKAICDRFIVRETGERIAYDVKAGSIEIAKEMVKVITEAKALHSRSPKFAEACDLWAQLIQEEVIDANTPEHTDWAFLQGSIYAGQALY